MVGDDEWYASQSDPAIGQPIHCPYAAVDRCPRYFESLDLVETLGGCALEPKLRKRMDKHWKKIVPMFPLPEHSTSVWKADGRVSMVNNFCPEVSATIYGWYASDLITYADEIDRDARHRLLSREGAPANDPRWAWSSIHALHYRKCPAYALLQANTSSTQPKEVFTLKPGMWGFSIDLKALWKLVISKIKP